MVPPKLPGHEIGHALYKALTTALGKTSWNVKQQRVNITPQQANDRRSKLASSLGLKPLAEGVGAGEFPAASRNQLPYGRAFGLEHELAHAMMTPEGQTVRQYQRHLTAHQAPSKSSVKYGEPDYAHEETQHHENVANQLEYKIDRRAGVDPHRFRSQFRTDMQGPKYGDSDLDQAEDLYDPKSGSVKQKVAIPGGKSGRDEYPIAGAHIREEAPHYAQRFDQGARFNHLGRPVAPAGVDARINERARRVRLPGEHLFRKSEQGVTSPAPNLTHQESLVADQKKSLSIPLLLHGLHKGLRERVTKFEQDCLNLRKAELGKEEGVSSGGPTVPGAGDMGMAERPMAKAESCKSCGEPMAKCGCDRAEHWAKSESKSACKVCGDKDCSCDKMEKWAKGEMPAGSAPDAPGKKEGVLPDDKKSKASDLDEGSGGDKIAKAGFRPGSPSPMGGSAPPTAGIGPRPKLPGAGKAAGPAMPKPPAAPGAKPPAMGAGQPAMKAEIKVGVSKSCDKCGKGGVGKDEVLCPKCKASGSHEGMKKNFGVGSVLTASGPPVKGPAVGGLPKPAKVQTMVERVASRVPQAAAKPPMGKNEFAQNPHATVVGKKPVLAAHAAHAEPPLTPLAPQGLPFKEQIANVKSSLAKRPALPGAHMFGKGEKK